MHAYAERLKAGIEIERPIALGVLKIKAKLGELMPAESKGGRGKETVKQLNGFTRPTVMTYRKLAKHQDRLGEFYDSLDDVPTQAGFLKFAAGAHVGHNAGENEWYTPEAYIEAARVASKVEFSSRDESVSWTHHQSWVSSAVESCTRVQGLSWSHHREVASCRAARLSWSHHQSWVAGNVEPTMRIENVSWTHHHTGTATTYLKGIISPERTGQRTMRPANKWPLCRRTRESASAGHTGSENGTQRLVTGSVVHGVRVRGGLRGWISPAASGSLVSDQHARSTESREISVHSPAEPRKVLGGLGGGAP